MGRTQKIVTTSLWALVVVAMIALVASRKSTSTKFNRLFDAPAFEFVDQNGKPFGHADLRGSVWIADFIFVNCAGPCPIMTSKLADVQKRVPRSDVKLVSFSVDPDRVNRSVDADDESVLRECVRDFFPGANGPMLRASTCIFTNTPDEHFIIDRLPEAPEALVVSACSGHGFKFCSVIGEIVADLVADGETRHDLSLFSLERFGLAGR